MKIKVAIIVKAINEISPYWTCLRDFCVSPYKIAPTAAHSQTPARKTISIARDVDKPNTSVNCRVCMLPRRTILVHPLIANINSKHTKAVTRVGVIL